MNLSKKILSKNITPEQKKKLLKLFPEIFEGEKINSKKFNLIFENSKKPEIVYHYTSINTLFAILNRIENETESDSKDDYFILRGTHIEFLNDTTEFYKSCKLMSEIIQEYENSLEEDKNKHVAKDINENTWKRNATMGGFSTLPFVTSFSENSDNLPMWNTYGDNGNGVAIGIKKIDIEKLIGNENVEKPTWVKCVYDEIFLKSIFNNKIKNKLYNLFKNTNSGLRTNGFIISKYLCILKDPAYEYEQEWRLVKSCSKYDTEKKIKFQATNGLIKPYIEYKFPKFALKEIVIGPCANMELTTKSIEMLLEGVGYNVNKGDEKNDNSVLVKNSKVPFRHI